MNILLSIIIIALLVLFIFSIIALNNQKKTREGVEVQLNRISEFTPQKTLIKNMKGISLDKDSRKICLIVGDNFIVKSFEDIVEAQVVVDEDVVTKTSRGSQLAGAAVGTVLAGGVGAIIGGLSGKTSSTRKIKNVSLKLLINDLDIPVHEIFFLELTPYGQTIPEVALKEADKWNDLLKVVIFQNSISR